jgi:hypothetical protein
VSTILLVLAAICFGIHAFIASNSTRIAVNLVSLGLLLLALGLLFSDSVADLNLPD